MSRTIVLAGNPNVGKSVIFNKLTGSYAVVSNYPGTTVDVSRGMMNHAGEQYQVIDTPGTNSLIPGSEDEQVTRDVLLRENPSVVVQVADTKNLNRALVLTLEIIELGLPMLLVLNMSDEARSRGIKTDAAMLSRILGIPVVETVGTTGEGLSELKRKVDSAAAGNDLVSCPGDINTLLKKITAEIPQKTPFRGVLAKMLVSGDESAGAYLPEDIRQKVAARVKTEPGGFIKPFLRIIASNPADQAGISFPDPQPGGAVQYIAPGDV